MKITTTRIFVLLTFTLALAAGQMIGQTPVKKNPLDKGDFKVGFSPKTRAKTPNKAMPADDKAIPGYRRRSQRGDRPAKEHLSQF